MPFIVLVMFIRATAATVDISDSVVVTRHFKTNVYRKNRSVIYLLSAGGEKNEIITWTYSLIQSVLQSFIYLPSRSID